MDEFVRFICRTDILLVAGVLLDLVYIITMKSKKKNIEFLDVSTIFISVMSIVAGIKLFATNLKPEQYTTDSVLQHMED